MKRKNHKVLLKVLALVLVVNMIVAMMQQPVIVRAADEEETFILNNEAEKSEEILGNLTDTEKQDFKKDDLTLETTKNLDNHFHAYAENDHFSVAYLDKVTMRVIVEADDVSQICYQWYLLNWDDEYIPIDGETSDTLTIYAHTRQEYMCFVWDQYGNSANLYFYIDFAIDNHFNAYAENDHFLVPYGEAITLKVIVEADDVSKMLYQWAVYNGEGEYVSIEGEMSDMLSIKAYTKQQYMCFVRDQYGNSANLIFYIEIDIDNHLSVHAENDYYEVPFGDTITMNVIVEADDKSEMTYKWSAWNWFDDETEYIGETSEPCLTQEVCKNRNYHCYVTDRYGNSAEASFMVVVDNQLWVTAEAFEYYVNPGDSVELKVSITALDTNDMVISWRQMVRNDGSFGLTYGDLVEEDSESLTVSNIQEAMSYMCNVTDRFGNSWSVSFDIYIDNGFEVVPIVDSDEVIDEYGTVQIETAPNSEIEMKVNAETADNSQIRYEWYVRESGFYSYSLIEGENGPSLNILCSDGDHYFVCVVKDQYNNTKLITFHVVVASQVKGDANGDGEVNRADRIYLARAIAGWDGYELPPASVADFNGDGEVNRADRIYLARAIAGWDGYDL